jgi:hypothetical protein
MLNVQKELFLGLEGLKRNLPLHSEFADRRYHFVIGRAEKRKDRLPVSDYASPIDQDDRTL